MRRLAETRIWKWLERLQSVLLMLITAMVAIVLFTGVIMRYVFKSDVYGIEEITCILALWMYFLGSSYGSYEESHIRADMVQTFVKNKRVVDFSLCFADLVSVVVTAYFSVVGINYFIWNVNAGVKSAYWHFPLLLSQSAITVGMLLMLLYSLYHFLDKLLKFVSGDSERLGKEAE